MADQNKFIDEAGMIQILKEVKQYHEENATEVDAIEIPVIETTADEIFERVLVIRLAADNEVVDPAVAVTLAVGELLEDKLAINTAVTMTSDAPTVIEVNVDGKMEALTAGTANITVTPVDTNLASQTIMVEVQ